MPSNTISPPTSICTPDTWTSSSALGMPLLPTKPAMSRAWLRWAKPEARKIATNRIRPINTMTSMRTPNGPARQASTEL